MKLTYFGHSSFGVELPGTTLFFDPYITGNPLAAEISLSTIPADYIFISHGHFDHLDDVVELARLTSATVVSTFEVANWIKAQGVEKVLVMNHGGTHRFDFGKVKIVNAVHSSSMPDGSYGGSAAGFVVTTPDHGFYYSGDTALTYDMKLIGETNRLDFAVLCVGDHFTMGYEDAIIAADFVGVNKVVGVHYDTFPPIKLDKEAAQAAFKAVGKQLLLPTIGGSIEI